jgi:NAD(P)-dependent dehydrogenase (short-subunit alcohol dehydrogenase family)
MLPPEERVILVSGANRGIGRAVARRLYADGYNLSLGARDVTKLAGITAGMATARVFVHPYEARDAGAAQDWVAATAAYFGRIDGLVNNAGILRPFSVEDDDETVLDALWEVNVKGPYRLIREAFPHLKASGAGRIVTLVSLSGKRVKSASAAGYAMSKFASLALAHAARFSGWEHGVRSTALCPGFVRTDMTMDVGSVSPDDMIAPETVARLVSMLLSLPNNASVAELPVNCVLEHTY